MTETKLPAGRINPPDEPIWIGHGDWTIDSGAPLTCPVAFRRSLTLNRSARGTIRISATPRYHLWVNGTFVGEGPARSWAHQQSYDEMEVSDLLKPGENCLAVLVPSACTLSHYAPLTRLGLYVDATFCDEDGSFRLISDASWVTHEASWMNSHGLLGTLPTPVQEHAVGNLTNWMTQPPGEDWKEAKELGPVGSPPWYSLRERSLPYLCENPVAPPVVWQGRFADSAMRNPSENLTLNFNHAECCGEAVSIEGSGEVHLEPGDVLTWDVGRTRSVRAGFEVLSLEGTVRLEVFYSEAHGERPSARRGFGRPYEGMCDTWQPDAPGQWFPLAVRGCRFVSLRLSGTGSASVRWCGKTVDYPFQSDATFHAGSDLINAIWKISENNLRSCARDGFVDCCSREDVVWAGDAIISGKAAFYTFGDSALWRRSLELACGGIDEHGFGPSTVPSRGGMLIDQNLRMISSIHEYYMFTGDEALVHECLGAARRLLGLCLTQVTEEDLFVPPSSTWHWIDWGPIEKRHYALPLNLILIRAARSACLLADVVPDGALTAIAREIDERLSRAVLRFWDDGVGAFRSHLPPAQEYRQSRFNRVEEPAVWGMYANCYALELEIGDHEQRARAAANCAKWLAEETPRECFVNIGATDLLLTPLCRAGHADSVLRWIDRRYQAHVDCGTPTFAENWRARMFNTAHGWGSSVNSLLIGGLLGLRPTEPGWRSYETAKIDLPWDYSYRLKTSAGEIEIA